MSQGGALKNCPRGGVFVPLGQPRSSYIYLGDGEVRVGTQGEGEAENWVTEGSGQSMFISETLFTLTLGTEKLRVGTEGEGWSDNSATAGPGQSMLISDSMNNIYTNRGDV